MRNLLLLSNSTNYGEPYFEYPKKAVKRFLGPFNGTAAFIPYAGVSLSYDKYEKEVQKAFKDIGYKVESVHHSDDPAAAIKQADAVIVGGGNSFRLLERIQFFQLASEIQIKIHSGTPYIGWSAGANLACPTIRTTNDMPVIEPGGLNALNLVPFQINPHYTERVIPNHGGESRDQRIQEFLELNREIYVVGLREGTMLKVQNRKIELIGSKPARIFRYGLEPRNFFSEHVLDFLLE
jgi:dipeptidase E